MNKRMRAIDDKTYKQIISTMQKGFKHEEDYLMPNLIPAPEPEGELRKFGLMRKSYLENHRRGVYVELLLSGELKKYLFMIQEKAEERFDLLVE